jgi:hypothetical protein
VVIRNLADAVRIAAQEIAGFIRPFEDPDIRLPELDEAIIAFAEGRQPRGRLVLVAARVSRRR